MARARLEIAAWYLKDSKSNLHEELTREFERARDAILSITNQSELLDNNKVIQQSIRERNEDTDVLNAIQVELLARWRQVENEDDALKSIILLSVNALASAMQSTG